MQRARARVVLRYMHDKYKSTRIPSSFKCDSTNKQVLDRFGTGYLTQYVPALRDMVHSKLQSYSRTSYSCRPPSCLRHYRRPHVGPAGWPGSGVTAHTVTPTHTHARDTAHTRASLTLAHTLSALAASPPGVTLSHTSQLVQLP